MVLEEIPSLTLPLCEQWIDPYRVGQSYRQPIDFWLLNTLRQYWEKERKV